MEALDTDVFRREVNSIILAAKYSHSEHDQLLKLLDNLLSPSNDIDDENAIKSITWVIAGGSTPEEFASTVRLYDKANPCGLVWTENIIAYRCNTCKISPFMSLCTECFSHGNHVGHDYKIFISETGGACDCGETNAIKESGCCSFHSPQRSALQAPPGPRASRSDSNSSSNEQSAPPELLCIANVAIPRLFLRLIQSMREESKKKNKAMKGQKFIKMLQWLSDMGIIMRQVMIQSLMEPHVYENLISKYKLIPHCHKNIYNKNFLEELVYWIVKYEFPDDFICLLLSMRSDYSYKEEFTRAYVMYYELMSETILKSSDPETLCKHVAAVSVQLFSVECIAVKMTEEKNLLNLLVNTLHNMIQYAMTTVEVDSTFMKKRVSKILDCDHEIMKNMHYWPIKSDLKELLSHQPVAMKFFEDDQLLGFWFDFIFLFQGMNKVRYIPKGFPHVEQESEMHIGAITAELEISATTMWTLLSHLKDKNTANFTQRAVQHCWRNLKKWTESVQLCEGDVSFHLPLHRNLAMFIRQGVQYQGLELTDLLPPAAQLKPIARQLLRLQSYFYQIMGRLWLRNGTSIVSQAETYCNSTYCKSMVDADIFLLQIIADRLPRDEFLQMVFEQFLQNKVLESEKKSINIGEESIDDREAQEQISKNNLMLENCLIFLATLTSTVTNLGMPDEDGIVLEMSTLLCRGDKAHSEIMDQLPERCGTDSHSQLKIFDKILNQVADFQKPKNMQQGKFSPKPTVWENIFDPIHLFLRSNNREEFQASLNRFHEYAIKSNKNLKSSSLWPPFRIPKTYTESFPDPRNILSSSLMQEVLLIILYKAVYLKNIPDIVIPLTVYLLELEVSNSCKYRAEPENLSLKYQPQQEKFSFVNVDILKTSDLPHWEELKTKNLGACKNIISLLLKLQDQLQGTYNNTFQGTTVLCEKEKETFNQGGESRIGDGTFFIENIIKKLAKNDPSISEFVFNERKTIKDASRNEQEEKQRQEMRRKVKERQLQLMADFAVKGKQFMRGVKGELNAITDEHQPIESSECAIHCVICSEKVGGTSEPENPYGIITFLAPSSILAHRKPSKDAYSLQLFSNIEETFQQQWSAARQELQKHFDNASVQVSVPVDYGIGASIRTCGHHFHMDCLNSYINSLGNLKKPLPQDSLKFSYKQFICPTCRQAGNSFLPIISYNNSICNDRTDSVSDPDTDFITRLLRKKNTTVLSQKEQLGVGRFLQDLCIAANGFDSRCNKSLTSCSLNLKSAQAIGNLFLNSLEIEVLRICGPVDLKRSCVLPLYPVLKQEFNSLSSGNARKLTNLWKAICGTKTLKERSVPVLIRDLNVLMAHLILQLPHGTKSEWLNIIADNVSNLRLAQIMCHLVLQLVPEDFQQVKVFAMENSQSHTADSLQSILLKVMECYETFNTYPEIYNNNNQSTSTIISCLLKNSNEFEIFVKTRMTTFLRRFAILRRICEGSTLNTSKSEPMVLTDVKFDEDIYLFDGDNNCSDFLHPIRISKLVKVLPLWIKELMQSSLFSKDSQISTSSLVKPILANWDLPKLVKLPSEFSVIIQRYRMMTCQYCNCTPKRPALCLACGRLVCLNSVCCIDKKSNMTGVIKHSIDCGVGSSSVFLCALTSAVLVVRGNYVLIWGSIFLDSFGEEDLDLKRGNPLYLCEERFNFLQKEWVSDSFSGTERRWCRHNNML